MNPSFRHTEQYITQNTSQMCDFKAFYLLSLLPKSLLSCFLHLEQTAAIEVIKDYLSVMFVLV